MRSPENRCIVVANMKGQYARFAFFLALIIPSGVFAQPASFADVAATRPDFAAIEALKEANIIQGYPDGTFQPDKTVSRAEAVTLILRPLASAAQMESAKGISRYTDVPKDAWYANDVELARGEFGMIDGPPQTTAFSPSSPVNKAQFLKLLLRAYDVDPSGSYGEITTPVASDVARSGDWFYPYVRYAITASMDVVEKENVINPGKPLTRGEIAQLLYDFLRYRQGARTQFLLDTTEKQLIYALSFLQSHNTVDGEFAATRALLASRGALASSPDEPIAKGAVKVSEGFKELFLADAAGTASTWAGVIEHAGLAWHKAEEARAFGLDALAAQLQEIAKKMADEARTHM